MASNMNDTTLTLNNSNNIESSLNSSNVEDLIDLDKELPLKMDSNWLLECNGNSVEMQDSFSKLHFSNPIIKNIVKGIYQSGKSKQILHQLLYWNEKMTVSCDNCSYLYRNNEANSIIRNQQNEVKRHSIAAIRNSNNSLNDSLDSLTICDDSNSSQTTDNNGNDVNIKNNRMTKSNITEHSKEFTIPTASTTVPTITGEAHTNNILSRTYDKTELEVLKLNELSSQSVFVPNIVNPKITNYSNIKLRKKSSHTSDNQNDLERNHFGKEELNVQSNRRLFPIGTSIVTPSAVCTKVRPYSSYPVDKLIKSTIVTINQNQQSNLITKRLIPITDIIDDSEVVTPINRRQLGKPSLAVKNSFGLRRSNTCRK